MHKWVNAILYVISIGYAFSILIPALYCFRHACKGPDGDIFMLPFFLTPLGGPATAFSLYAAIQEIKKKQSWVYWLPAIVFAIILTGVIGFVVLLIIELGSHR